MSTLHLSRVPLRTDRLFALARTLRIPARATEDVGYLVHALFAELFGDLAPKPFCFPAAMMERVVPVLGYTNADEQALRTHAQRFADPLRHQACVFEDLASKPMPERWVKGTLLGFEVRACPIVRKARGVANGKHRGPELDVYLDALLRSGEGAAPEREQVYSDWLRKELSRGGAASLVDVRLRRLQRERLIRKRHDADKTSRVFDRPDVGFGGTLLVDDPDAFSALLARGVGRHRAFGFGMLLLRPPP